MASNSMEALVKDSWVLVVSLEALVVVSQGQDLVMRARPRLLTSTRRITALVLVEDVEDRYKVGPDKASHKVKVLDKEIKADLKLKDIMLGIALVEVSVVLELVLASVHRSKIPITNKAVLKVTLGTLKAEMMAAFIPTRGNRDIGNKQVLGLGNQLIFI